MNVIAKPTMTTNGKEFISTEFKQRTRNQLTTRPKNATSIITADYCSNY